MDIYLANRSGVSSVIAVVLMVAITVALVSLVTLTVFNTTTSDNSEPLTGFADIKESSTSVTMTVIRKGNVDEFTLVDPSGSVVGSATETGESVSDSDKNSGSYKVIASGEGTENVLSTKDASVEGSPNESPSTTSSYSTADKYGTLTDTYNITEVSLIEGFTFGDEGSNMFVTSASGSNAVINSYNLSTDYDISTASFDESIDVGSEDPAPTEISFNNDGTKMYILGLSSGTVYQYSLLNSYDIGSATQTESFDVSTAGASVTGLSFNNDGSKLYVTSASNDNITSFDLSEAFNVSTASENKSVNINFVGNPGDVDFSEDGSLLYISAEDSFYSYNLSTPFDAETKGNRIRRDVSAQTTRARGIDFNKTGSSVYIADNSESKIHQYSK